MKLLFHICCAPCATGMIPRLSEYTDFITGFYYNPNIHPEQEHAARRMSVEALSQDYSFPVIYDNENRMQYWKDSLSKDKESRCMACYGFRMENLAKEAADKGFDTFTTSLLASPWQDHEKIRKMGEMAAQKVNLAFLYEDFRTLYREGKNEAFKKGYYFQKYCGCLYSYQESTHPKKPKYEF